MAVETSDARSNKRSKKLSKSLLLVTISLVASFSTLISGIPQAFAASSQGIYTPINPTRICDTRPIQTGVVSNQCNTNGNGTLSAGSTLQVGITGLASIPSNATAVVANITATDATSPGYLTVFPSGTTKPSSSSINFTSNESVPNLIEVALGTNGDISIYNFMGSTDVIVDVEGYVAPPVSSTTSGQFVSLAPSRICDTRPVQTGVASNQCNTNGNGTLSAGSTLQVGITGLASIPSNATAVVANVTATDATSPGYLTVFSGPSVPTTSNVNFGIGPSVANRVIVPINSNGDISIYNVLGSTDVIVDINGYYTGSNSATTGSFFTGSTPSRICDTRPIQTGVVSNQCNTNGNTILNSNSAINVQVVGLDSIPVNASAVVVNVTTTNSVSGGYFTLYPEPPIPISQPIVSDLNWTPGETRANLAIVKVGANNSITVYSSSRSDLIIDVIGYYAPPIPTIPVPSVTSVSPSTGLNKGGTQVTITGTGFSGATTVDFGTSPAISFTVNSDTSITATSPAGSMGAVDVTVTTAGGTSTTSAQDSFTYGGSWKISEGYPAIPRSINNITCPSATECFAVGNNSSNAGIALGTTDSGTTWTTEATPSGDSINNITCPSATECFAVGNNSANVSVVLGTTDSGTAWTTEATPSGDSINNITCPSATECFAVGNNSSSVGIILGTTDSGTTWTTEATPSGVGSINVITCPSATECFAVGNNSSYTPVILGTTDSGTTWTTETTPSGVTYVYAITCPSVTECFAAGTYSSNAGIILGTTDSGTTWTTEITPSRSSITNITCPSVTECFAYLINYSNGLGVILGTIDSGTTWTFLTMSSYGYIYGITCPSVTECFTYGYNSSDEGIILGTTDSGTTWTTATVPAVRVFTDVTCPSVTVCFAGGEGDLGGEMIVGTNSSGTTWTTETTVATSIGLQSFNTITCPSVTECFAAGNNSSGVGIILGTIDSGTTWTTEAIPSGLNTVNGITCPSVTECFAIGNNSSNTPIILGTTDSGTNWTTQATPSSVAYLYGITCPSVTECFVYGYGNSLTAIILGTTDSGTTWNTETIPSGLIYVSSVTCQSATVCFAVGNNSSYTPIILGTTDSGTNWTTVTFPSGDSINTITCPSATECFAAGNNSSSVPIILGTTDSGTTWAIESGPSGTAIKAITCPSATVCIAVGNNSSYAPIVLSTTDFGTTWAIQSSPGGVTINNITCPSTTECFMLGHGVGQVGPMILTLTL